MKIILTVAFLFLLNSFFCQDCKKVFKDNLTTNTFELAKIKFDYTISKNSVSLGMYLYLNEEQRLSIWKSGEGKIILHANDKSTFTLNIDYPDGIFISVHSQDHNKYYFPHIFVGKDYFKFIESHTITSLTLQETELDIKSKDFEVFQTYSKCVETKASEMNALLNNESDFKEIVKCKMLTDKVDEIEGYRIQKLGYVAIGYVYDSNKSNSFAFVVNLRKIKDDYYLIARINSVDYCLNSESSLAIKFSNDSIIKLKHMSDTDCGEGTELKTILKIDQIESLKTNEIVFARIYSTDGKIDVSNIEEANYFSTAFDCFE